jgi:hypothetical protein
MQMGNEYLIDLHEGQFGDHQLTLCTFGTIEQRHLGTLPDGQCRHGPVL